MSTVHEDEQLTVHTRDRRPLSVVRRGTGAPTVVFETGVGASHHAWGGVVPAIAEITETVAYDRSGLGNSPVDDAPRTLERVVDDLVDLLGQLGDGPFVLVGHGWGGPVVRCAAAVVPERIAGLVLVDQSDEGCSRYFTERTARLRRLYLRIAPFAARLGVFRVQTRRFAARLPESAAARMRAADGTVVAVRTQCAEMVGSLDDLRRLRADSPPLPDVPVTLISGTVASDRQRARRDALITAHRVRARSLPHGRHVTADQSGHMVPFSEPGVVIDEIARVIDTVRRAAPDVPPTSTPERAT